MERRPRSRLFFALPLLAGLVMLSACQKDVADTTLPAVLSQASDRIVDGDGRPVAVADLVREAKGRPASVSFVYVGCGGPAGRLKAMDAAAKQVEGGGDIFHVVLNAIDPPSRYRDLVFDITRGSPNQLDPERLRILFVEQPPLWPQEPNKAVDGVMEAMGLRYGRDRLVETVSGIGLFDRTGKFAGIRY